MGRLQIGMWNGFRPEFWQQYAARRIGGIEVSQCPGTDNLEALALFCEEEGLRFGVHTPIIAQAQYSLPKVTSTDSGELARK